MIWMIRLLKYQQITLRVLDNLPRNLIRGVGNIKNNTRSSRTKEVLIRIFMAVFLVIGLCLIFNKQIESYWLNWMGQQKVRTISRAEVKRGIQKNGDYDTTAVNALSLKAAMAAKKAKNMDGIGLIAIPSVGIKLPIYQGMTNSTLAIGSGTMKPNQKMGQGNYALAGHHMMNPNILFSPLSRVTPKHKVYLTDLKYFYVYQISAKRIIPDTMGRVINDHPQKIELTLITCASGTPGEMRRIAVIGDYKGKSELTEDKYQKYFIER